MRLLYFFFLLPHILLSQNPQPYFRNYMTEDGLPSSEVYHVIQDSEGYIWFGTDNGVSRFDGYEFKNFDINDGLPENVVFYLQEDHEGRIWMNTMSGKLSYLKEDSVHLYEYNYLIKEERERSKGVVFNISQFYISKDAVYLKLEYWGILKIDLVGKTKLFRGSQLGTQVIFEVNDVVFTNGTSFSDSMGISVNKANGYIYPPTELFKEEKRFFLPITMDFYRVDGNWACKLNDGSFLINRAGGTYYIKGKEKLDEWKNTGIQGDNKGFFQTQEGQIYQGYTKKKGLHIYERVTDYNRKPAAILLNGYSISSILIDQSGGLWATTIEKGVFYCKDLEQKVYNSNIGLPEDRVIAIEEKNDSTLFLGLWDGNIADLNIQSNQFSLFPKINLSLFSGDLFYDNNRNELWAGRYNLYYFQNNKWTRIYHTDKGKTYYIAEFPCANVVEPSKENNIVWTAGSKGFGKINLKTREIIIHSRTLGYEDRSLAILESKSNRIWLGSVDGLFEFRDSMLIPQKGHAAFQDRVEALGELSDSTLVFGIKGKGVYFWNPNEKEPYLNLNKTNGLTSNLVENMYVDEEDNVWVGTPFGLNKISINASSYKDPSNYTIKHFTTNHGLPSNEINMVRKFNDKLWVATSRGLINLIEQPESKISAKPIIQDIYLNGKRYSPKESIEIPFGNNNLVIEYVTLNYGLGRDNIPYRFQLLSGQSSDWTYTNNRTINFSSLSNGYYTFNVQSQNEDGYWSESTRYRFTILAPFWKRWWFILLSILGLIGLFVLVYKYRVRQVRHEANIQKKMIELERSALRSQMNPHFIFNALNAIQNYINKGDKLSANRYLSRFARLIRTALNHSRVTKILLEDEISTLENYLELEQMRFSGDFQYSISVGEEVEPFAIDIPSMLIQPFVENAIIHGLSVKEGIGKIDIDFRKSDNKLFVTIEDNGIGINQSLKNKKSSLHKSVGMTITKQRLEILNGKTNSPYLEVEELKNEDGKAAGTRVRLEINI